MKRIFLTTGFLTALTFILPASITAQSFVKTKPVKTEGLNSEAFRSLTFNGAWCWFSDPRALYYEGEHRRTYAGWIDNYGDIHVGYYDHDTRQITSKVIFDNLEVDDHDNPSILIDESGHLLVFFTSHAGPEGIYFTRSKKPEDVSLWSEGRILKLNDPAQLAYGGESYTYTCPVKLTAENGRIYLFWRGIDGKPTYSVSEDNGGTWSAGRIFFLPERTYDFRRPYFKVWSDGSDRIHVAITDGHPRREPENSIHYFCIRDEAFYSASGEKIKSLDEGPLTPDECEKVYDAALTKQKAWIWDVAADASGNVVVAYAKFPDDEDHILAYARWDGEKWKNYDLVNSGKWYPQTPEGEAEPEPNYSGGINIDKENVNVVYLSVSRNEVFEIERWETSNGGRSWTTEAITSGSSKDNVRPFAIRGAWEGDPLQVLWVQNTKYLHYAYGGLMRNRYKLPFADRFQTAIKMDIPSPEVNDVLSTDGIWDIMHRVADWQLANPLMEKNIDSSPLNWLYGAFYTGLMKFYEMTGEERYVNEMYNAGSHGGWQLMDDIFHADRLTIADVWCDMFDVYPEPVIIDKARWAMDIHLARNYKELTDVRFEGNPAAFEWWTWCDALYMAPPSFVRMSQITGDPKYLEYADTQWWKTSDYLYSKFDSLYFRDDRYINWMTPNGKKLFWARGNGWVIAGLARMLEDMPADYKNRARFDQQYLQMAHKLLKVQDEDGLWRVSLLDPEYLDTGESSGSSFFTFALAWGLNNGLLDESFRPAVEKSWKALCGNVNSWGRLGYVQQVAGSPYPFYKDQWQVYATGAFLLAGCEMVKLIEK